MRHVCVNCGVVYGEGPNKPIKGFCSGCWDLHLATMRLNTRKLFVAKEVAAGNLLPVWKF